MRVAIIGGGLAGTSCAYVLKLRGHEPVIYEASGSLASGASGNAVGLYNPRFTAEKCPEQEFYAAAFFKTLEVFPTLENIDWNPCGALHLITDEKKARRFPQTVGNWGWDETDMRLIAANEASKIAGVSVGQEALYLPRSGTVSPCKLCQNYAEGIETHLNAKMQNVEADVVILASGMDIKGWPEVTGIPFKPVRGQITFVQETQLSRGLRCTISYGGYIAPAQGGVHCLGSTFQPWLDHSEIMSRDDLDNLNKLFTAAPALEGNYSIEGHRAAVRCTVPDHFPVIGQLADNLYISAAHGSHGILSSLMGAHILADMIGGKTTVSKALFDALSPLRFTKS